MKKLLCSVFRLAAPPLIFILIIFILCSCRSGEVTALEPNPTPTLPAKLAASLHSTDSDRIAGVPRLITDEHIPYLFPDKSGRILPDEPITRAEACAALYTLIENPVQGSCSFADVSRDDSFYDALCCLCAWGVISDSESFNPDGLLSRAQLVTMLSAFYPAPEGELSYVGSFLRRSADFDRLSDMDIPSFSDISGHWAEEYIENAVDRGWIDAGGKFYPDGAVSRGEFCRIVNRVLNRSCDTAVTLLTDDYPGFSDLPADHEYYSDISEAACKHDYSRDEKGIECWAWEAPEPGFCRTYGRLYCVQEDGTLLREEYLGNLYFDSSGRYTTGLEELDDKLADILVSLGTDDMDADDALRLCFRYIVQNYDYHYPTAESYGFDGIHSYYAFRALSFFKINGGVCYDYAAGFGYLARALGFNSYIVAGYCRSYDVPHGFVIIPENGVDYIYDTELEADESEGRSLYDLYRIRNGNFYYYIYEPWW